MHCQGEENIFSFLFLLDSLVSFFSPLSIDITLDSDLHTYTHKMQGIFGHSFFDTKIKSVSDFLA